MAALKREEAALWMHTFVELLYQPRTLFTQKQIKLLSCQSRHFSVLLNLAELSANENIIGQVIALHLCTFPISSVHQARWELTAKVTCATCWTHSRQPVFQQSAALSCLSQDAFLGCLSQWSTPQFANLTSTARQRLNVSGLPGLPGCTELLGSGACSELTRAVSSNPTGCSPPPG